MPKLEKYMTHYERTVAALKRVQKLDPTFFNRWILDGLQREIGLIRVRQFIKVNEV